MPLLEPSESCPALTDDAARAHLAIVAGSIAQLRAGDVERLLEAVTEAGDGAAFREWLLRQPLSERAAAIARAWVPSLAGPAAGATDQDVADDAPWVCPRCATRNSPPNAWCLCAHCGFDRCR